MRSREGGGLSARAAWLVFALFLCLYLLTARGRITVIDGLSRYQVTAAIAERGTVSLPGSWHHAFPGKRPGTFYSYYGLGQSLAALPLYLLGQAGARLLPGSNPQVMTEFAYSLLNPFMAAGLCAVFFAFCVQLGYSRRTALWLTVALGVGTILWQHSKDSFEHPQEALLGLAGVMSAHQGLAQGRLRLMWLSGLLLGAAVLTRESAVFFLGPTLVYVIVTATQAPSSPAANPLAASAAGPPVAPSGWLPGAARAARAAGALVGGAIPSLVVVGWYNALRSGSPLVGGYGATGHFGQFDASLLRGLAGLLVSPGKGLLEYDPILLFAVIFPSSLALFWRRARGLTALLAAIGLTYLVFYARFRYWDGGLCWGPRYLLAVIPLALLPLGEVLERLPAARRRAAARFSGARLGAAALSAIAGISIMIQLSSVLVDHQNWFREVAVRNQRGEHIAINSNPVNSPLLRQWQTLGRVLFGWRAGAPDWARDMNADQGLGDEFSTGIDLWWVSWPAENARLFRFATAASLAGLLMLLAWLAAPLARPDRAPGADDSADTGLTRLT